MKKQVLQQRFDELAQILKKDMNTEGYWTGQLSSSALGVAVAVAALHFHDREAYSKEIRKGLRWLQNNINKDGSFGDTPESPGNVSTSLLVYACANLYAKDDEQAKAIQVNTSGYLTSQSIDVNSPQVGEIILDHYQKDYTFSVPILTMCGLCGVPGASSFQSVPQLPFELSLLPRNLYRMLNLSVVSYAIPALIAVGIVVFKRKKSNFFWRFVRKVSIRPALKLLQKLMPASGGFLEAIPLTAFVCLSLTEAGYGQLNVVDGGMKFLRKTQRDDGSWPIDIDLSTWVTTLAVKAMRDKRNEVLSSNEQSAIASHLLANQNTTVHPFNGSQPGGWGWTNHSGSVPDGDDTPGAIIVLLQLKPSKDVMQQVLAGCNWLLQLQNRDGGFPTFSKGWGKLPFDHSCADLTGHAMLAISSCLHAYKEELDQATSTKYKQAFKRSFQFLKKHQRKDGSWLPLWFGNQKVADHTNPVYGTAKVLTYLQDVLSHSWLTIPEKQSTLVQLFLAEQYLLSVQNNDGSWGGDKDVTGSMEETALAVSALSMGKHEQACERGLEWLDHFYQKNGLKSSPIGLYFASLWYDEKMYPLTAYLEALARVLAD